MALTYTRKQIREAAADELGLFIPVVVDNVAGSTLTVSSLLDSSPNPEWLRNAFITKDGSAYRRIISMSSEGVLTLTGEPTGYTPGTPAGIYFLLSPEEWNRLLDRLLSSELYAINRTEITLTSGTVEYDLPSTVQKPTDVMGLYFRGTPSVEESAGAVKFLETGNSLKVLLYSIPAEATTLVVASRDFYNTLSSDTDTTTCPFALAWRGLQLAGIRRIFNKYPSLQEQFRGAFATAQREYDRARAREMPAFTAKDIVADTPYINPVPKEFW